MISTSNAIFSLKQRLAHIVTATNFYVFADGVQPKLAPRKGFAKRYDKVDYCTFCQKAIKSKISRHLLEVHKGSAVYDF